MRNPLILSVFLLSGSSAWALTPPVGWTSTGAHTAVLDPRHPERGELHEYLIGGGSGDRDELEFILMGAGLEPTSMTVMSSGSIELAFEDRRARARFRPHPDQAAWLILFTDDASSSCCQSRCCQSCCCQNCCCQSCCFRSCCPKSCCLPTLLLPELLLSEILLPKLLHPE